jgi:16S rRNA processing protein RimM
MVGVITDKKGYIGEMLLTNLVAEKIVLADDTDVNIGYSERFSRKYKLTSWRGGKKSAKIRIEGIDSDEKTKQLMEMGVFVDELSLKSNNPETTFSHELVGLNVIDNSTNKIIGVISEIMFLPANDVLVIDCGDNYLNLPFVEEYVEDIKVKSSEIRVNLPDGYEQLMESK